MSKNNPYEGIKGVPEAVRYEPHGFRDVIWCPYLNEPAILEWKNGKTPKCPNCNGNWEVNTHPFICNIGKPFQFITDEHGYK